MRLACADTFVAALDRAGKAGENARLATSIRLFLMLRLIAVSSLVFATVVQAQSAPVSDTWSADYARAESLREQAAALENQARIEREREDAACVARFLVNPCRKEAGDRYLEKIQQARAINRQAAEIEAPARRRELAARDAALAQEYAARRLPGASVAPAIRDRAPVPTAPPLKASGPVRKPRPTAEPITPQKQADEDIRRLELRARREQEAALRAQQASEDAARYDRRKAEHAARKAKGRNSDLPPLLEQGSDLPAVGGKAPPPPPLPSMPPGAPPSLPPPPVPR